ncbi:MAG: type VI secretion system baseplate subunit TssF [bacterium]
MSTDKYFEREYNFLQTAGEEFAKKHPTLGSLLHLSERQRKDPFVERLLEGFAFLAGRIHERLDDEFPEIAGGLLEILFPHFLRPFPSCAILQAKHRPGAVTQPVQIKRGSEVQTPMGKYKVKYKVYAGPNEKARVTEKEEPAEFIFRTTQDLTVRPMKIEDVFVLDTKEGNSELVIRIQPDRNINYETLNLDNLQIYLHGQSTLKNNLLLYLTRYVSSISVREVIDKQSEFVSIGKYKIGIPELSTELNYNAEDFAILPYAKQTFSGFRLLQEYFSFPERFFFVNIEGLNQYKGSKESYPIEIKFEFNRKLNPERFPKKENILLHCAPIVNLFSRSTEEVILTQRMPEYYIIPDLSRRKCREIYSIDKVVGIGEDKIEHYKYTPITTHYIADTTDYESDYKRFFSLFRRPIKGDMAETYIRVFGTSMELDLFPKEILSLQSTLSNGFLPPAYLDVGTINQPLNFPTGIEVSNITLPSEVMECPDFQNFLWSIIAHLSVSYNSLADTETLKSILHLYNWAKSHNHPNKKKIEGISKVLPPVVKSVIKNQSLIRGIEFRIEIDPDKYESGEGEIHLLGMVLNRFLSQYVTLNSYVFLTITELGTNRQYKWEPIPGEILPV